METLREYYNPITTDIYQAEILHILPYKEHEALILDRTIFYPEGGGQPGDRGTVNGLHIIDTQESEGRILHILSPDAYGRLQPGPTQLRLDIRRRRDISVHHTAQHLLSGIILSMYGAPTVSMHLGEEVCTIDVDRKEFSAEELSAVEDAVRDAIEADVPVITHLCPPEDVHDFPLRKIPPQGEDIIRVVEIQGHDFSPCCGTHLGSTGQIGIFRLLNAEKYKGKTRLGFIAGCRVLTENRMLRRNAEAISRTLKVPIGEISGAVSSLLERSKDFERRLDVFRMESAQHKAEALIVEMAALEKDVAGTSSVPNQQTKIVIKDFPGLDMDDVLLIGRAAQKLSTAVMVLISGTELKFAAFYSPEEQRRTGLDIRPVMKDAMEAAGGTGGGGPAFYQGAFSSADQLRAFLESLPEAL